MALLSLENVHFTYEKDKNSTNQFHLEEVNLTFNKGEFVSVLGPNGCGKSTLLKIISGLIKPDKGELFLNNREYNSISNRNLARTIAYVPQSTFTMFPFSVYEIVMMGRTPYLNFIGYETLEDKKYVEESLALVEISHLKNHGINEVSGGEAQLAFIARAIVQQPEIILLDEPNAHLDIKHQISIFNLIKKLNKEKSLTVISVSHDLNLAGFYSDRIILLKDGKIYSDNQTDEILTSQNIKNVFDVDTIIEVHPESNKLNIFLNPNLK